MWTRGDLNPLPPQCKCGALPTELLAQLQILIFLFYLFYFLFVYPLLPALRIGDKSHIIKSPITLVAIITPIKKAAIPKSL